MESASQVLLHAVPESEEEEGFAGWLTASAMCWRVFLNPHLLMFDRGQGVLNRESRRPLGTEADSRAKSGV